jgi:hypothetical protein
MYTSNLKRRLSFGKPAVVMLIVLATMAFSACDVVTNSGGDQAVVANALSVNANRTGVKQTVIIDQTGLEDIELDPFGDYVLGRSFPVTNWRPICDPSGVGPFMGTLDGAGYTITVQNYGAVTDYVGIFAAIGNGTTYPYFPVISNLTVEIAPMAVQTTSHYVGGLVGSVNAAQLNTITVTGNLNVDLQNPGPDPETYNVGGVAGSATLGQFTNDTIRASVSARSSSPIATVINVGGIAGLAQSSTFSNARIDGEYTGNYAGPAPAPVWKIVKVEEGYRAQSAEGPGSDGVNVGGAAGHADNSQFSAVVANDSVDARSSNSPVYAGGVVGFASGATITTSRTSGRVIGDGPGYNTSAGGVGGYFLASRITDSSSSSTIDLTGLAPGAFSDYNSWQIYAGGLAGYVGGSDAAPGLVDHSFASGTVRANSPYPYAGGLVGYLYGYSDFVNPAKNGSTVSRSWATGEVSSMAQDDPGNVNDNVPYAGGLVGYSSVTGSTIADSYATGNARATTGGTFAWAGGVVGANANNAVVLRTYATGDVIANVGNLLPPSYPPYGAEDPGPASGGIAGVNFFTAKTSVSTSVALNRRVYGNQSRTQNVVHRVVGELGDGTTAEKGFVFNNLAYSGMTVEDNWQPDPGPNGLDGANTIAIPDTSVYTGLGWDFDRVWTPGSDGYPVLR